MKLYFILIVAGLLNLNSCGKKDLSKTETLKDTLKTGSMNESKKMDSTKMPDSLNGFDKATFAGGCYWCMEASFEKLS